MSRQSALAGWLGGKGGRSDAHLALHTTVRDVGSGTPPRTFHGGLWARPGLGPLTWCSAGAPLAAASYLRSTAAYGAHEGSKPLEYGATELLLRAIPSLVLGFWNDTRRRHATSTGFFGAYQDLGLRDNIMCLEDKKLVATMV